MGPFSSAPVTYSVKTVSPVSAQAARGVPLLERRLVALGHGSAHAQALAGVAVRDEGGVSGDGVDVVKNDG